LGDTVWHPKRVVVPGGVCRPHGSLGPQTSLETTNRLGDRAVVTKVGVFPKVGLRTADPSAPSNPGSCRRRAPDRPAEFATPPCVANACVTRGSNDCCEFEGSCATKRTYFNQSPSPGGFRVLLLGSGSGHSLFRNQLELIKVECKAPPCRPAPPGGDPTNPNRTPAIHWPTCGQRFLISRVPKPGFNVYRAEATFSSRHGLEAKASTKRTGQDRENLTSLNKSASTRGRAKIGP
jgi:hypothetical protein